MHAAGPASTREDKATAVRARLEGLLALPSRDVPKRESQIVVESNFMDSGFFDRSDCDSGGEERRVPGEVLRWDQDASMKGSRRTERLW